MLFPSLHNRTTNKGCKAGNRVAAKPLENSALRNFWCRKEKGGELLEEISGVRKRKRSDARQKEGQKLGRRNPKRTHGTKPQTHIWDETLTLTLTLNAHTIHTSGHPETEKQRERERERPTWSDLRDGKGREGAASSCCRGRSEAFLSFL
jgi:hypothetical protein